MKTDVLIRLIEEYRGLEDKIRKAEIALKGDMIPDDAKTLLRTQVGYMKKYHDAVLDRIGYQLKKDMYGNVSELH